MSKPITISIVGNAGPLKKSIKEADVALDKFGAGLKKFGLAAAAGIGTLAAGIGFAAKQAAEDQKSFVLMETAIRNVTGATHDQIKAVDDQIAAMSLATGVADDKLRPAFAALTRGTRDIETSTRDFGLVLDVATSLQLDATVVAEALAKGYEGNMKALAQLSPELKTMIKDGADMNEILTVLAGNFGGASAAAADTFEGRMARLNVAMSEIVEQIGYAVLPILEKLAGFVADKIVPVVQEMADAFSEDGLGGVIGLTTDKLLKFYNEAGVATKSIITATIALGGMFAAMKALAFIQTVITLVNGLTIAINRASVSMAGFQTTALGMAKIVGLVFASVAASVEMLFADNAFALKGLLERFAMLVNTFIAGIEKAASGVNYVINSAIRAYNLINPFQDIPLLPTNVKLGRMSEDFGSQRAFETPKAPEITVPSVPSFPAPAPIVVPEIPDVTVPSGGGGGGGGGTSRTRTGGEMTIQPIAPDYSGLYRPDDPRFLDFLPGELAQMEGGGNISITVNTVSADANLPNLIVEALQTYNLVSGPLDVQIAV